MAGINRFVFIQPLPFQLRWNVYSHQSRPRTSTIITTVYWWHHYRLYNLTHLLEIPSFLRPGLSTRLSASSPFFSLQFTPDQLYLNVFRLRSANVTTKRDDSISEPFGLLKAVTGISKVILVKESNQLDVLFNYDALPLNGRRENWDCRAVD